MATPLAPLRKTVNRAGAPGEGGSAAKARTWNSTRRAARFRADRTREGRLGTDPYPGQEHRRLRGRPGDGRFGQHPEGVPARCRIRVIVEEHPEKPAVPHLEPEEAGVRGFRRRRNHGRERDRRLGEERGASFV